MGVPMARFVEASDESLAGLCEGLAGVEPAEDADASETPVSGLRARRVTPSPSSYEGGVRRRSSSPPPRRTPVRLSVSGQPLLRSGAVYAGM